MSLFVIIAVVLGAFCLFTLLHGSSASGSRRPSRAQRVAFDQCDTVLRQGYLADSCGNADEALLKFGQALTQARISEDALQLSESLNGLARAHMKKGDGKTAIPLLEEALLHEPQWYTPKPNYSSLMRRELEEAKALAAKQTD